MLVKGMEMPVRRPVLNSVETLRLWTQTAMMCTVAKFVSTRVITLEAGSARTAEMHKSAGKLVAC